MTSTDDDDFWTVCNSPSFDLLSCDVQSSDAVDCTRAVGSVNPTSVEVVLDSGADGSVLPLEFAHIGLHVNSSLSASMTHYYYDWEPLR